MSGEQPNDGSKSFGPGGTLRSVTATPPGSVTPLPGDEPDLSGTVLGNYRLVRKIAEGGMGVVYEAVQTTLDRRVALKILNSELAAMPEFLSRFQREARAAAALNHPNLVQVHDFIHAENRLCLIMEFIDGEDLAAYVERVGKLEPFEALSAIEEAAQALKFAWTKSIIHRDVKPSNLMRTQDGRIKVSDMGLAKVVTENSDLTLTSIALGSPHFMAPEQAKDAANVDHRADIYALGITLLFLLTGKRPFDGGTPYSIVLGHISKPLPRGVELGTALPEPVEQLIRNMAAKERDERYLDYDLLIADIQRVRNGFKPALKPSTATPSQKRNFVIAGAIGLAVLAAAIGSFVLISQNSSRTAAPSPLPAPANVENASAAPARTAPPQAPPDPPQFGGGMPPHDSGMQPPPHEMMGGRPSEPQGMGMRLPMGRPPMRTPIPLSGSPEAMIAQIERYAKDHPQNYHEVVEAYDVIRRSAPAHLRSAVDAKAAGARQALEKALEPAISDHERKMNERLRAGDVQGAFNAWSTFPTTLRNRDVDDRIRSILQKALPPGFQPAPPR